MKVERSTGGVRVTLNREDVAAAINAYVIGHLSARVDALVESGVVSPGASFLCRQYIFELNPDDPEEFTGILAEFTEQQP